MSFDSVEAYRRQQRHRQLSSHVTDKCLLEDRLTSALKGARLYARPFERVVSPRSLTSLISTRWPIARAYRCKVTIEGECLSLPDSSRAMADCVVPTRAANSACVRPEAARALSTSSINENSSASSSYAFLTSGRASARALNCLKVLVISDFLHPIPRNLELPFRSLFALLHELVKHHDLPPDHSAKEYACNSFSGLESQLEQPIAHCARVRLSDGRAIDLHALGISHKAGNKTDRQRVDLGLDSAAVKGDLPVHSFSIADSLCLL